ncbi:TetR/AcrR family transcriptional regulator [Frankia sp. R82]|uniref:TetR/AcrR family transcriptional regulator n=1 Tax=Frankia sp. R82 TaxID=2950553 RepID=UPI002042CA93|nr:TetR/AcrR family transcriptional regulator [Frankia sp. R82]MCM3886037.1 TetR family transcriptional regulator [Frankia sp. R82]
MSTGNVEGLRERKKRRTRQAIIEVAHELFTEKGFEATTVEEIAAGADVSVRTLFRYFTSKEAIALAPLEEMGDLTVAALRRRPVDEPPLLALRNAALSAWGLMSPDGASLRQYADHLLPVGGASPLAGAVLHRLIAVGDRLAAELAVSEPAGDVASAVQAPVALPLPELDARLTVSVFLAAVQVAIRSWCAANSTDLQVLLTTVEACLDRLGPTAVAPAAAPAAAAVADPGRPPVSPGPGRAAALPGPGRSPTSSGPGRAPASVAGPGRSPASGAGPGRSPAIQGASGRLVPPRAILAASRT